MTQEALEIPESITYRWMQALADTDLVLAEAALRDTFRTQENRQRERSGSRYMLLAGPPALVTAWHRWTIVSNAVRARGLEVLRAR